jgi:tetratricopeptide (TPR) repeat protein
LSVYPYKYDTLNNKVILQEEIKKYPQDVWLMLELARYHYNSKNFKESFKLLDDYADTTGRITQEHLMAYWAAGDNKKALQLAERNPRIQNEFYPRYLIESLILLENNDLPAARETFKKALVSFGCSWNLVRYASGRYEKNMQKKLITHDKRLLQFIINILNTLPQARRQSVKNRLYLLGIGINTNPYNLPYQP